MEYLLIPLSVAFGLLTFGLAARWYLIPTLDARPRASALLALTLPHALRYIGLAFLAPGVVAADLPAAFAIPAAYGDLLTAFLALLAALALRKRWTLAIPIVWVFNVFGTLDLLNALLQGLLHIQQVGQLGGAYMIPSLLVPAYLISHVLIFRLLRRPDKTEAVTA
jgi:hypothetical protein